jgi:nitrate/nitrite transporter NarK
MGNGNESHRSQRIFFGWYIVAIALLTNFMSVGTALYGLNAFMEPVCQLRNWTRTDVNMALVLGTFSGYMAQCLYGWMINFVPLRRLMLFGGLTSGIAFAFLMNVPMLWQFHLLYVLLYIGNGAYGGIVAATAVNNWFRRKRGRALGFATAGISLSGAILPLIFLALILRVDLNRAGIWIGVAIAATGILAWAVVRDWPESYGFGPDGESLVDFPYGGNQISNPLNPVVSNWPFARLIRTAAFWKVGIAYAMIMCGAVGVMSQLKPRFSDIGFSDWNAMLLMAATAFCGAVGKAVWGILCDRFQPLRVAAAMAVVNAIGLVPSMFHNSWTAVFAFILIFGFAMGGAMSTYPVLISDLFGRLSFASVYRYMALFLMLQMGGFLIAGQSFDRLGSYDTAYTIFLIMDVAAAVLLLRVSESDRLSLRQVKNESRNGIVMF